MLRSLKKLTGALCLFAYAASTFVPTAHAAGSGSDPILHIIDADTQNKDVKKTKTQSKSKKRSTAKRNTTAKKSKTASAPVRKDKYSQLIRKAAAKHGVPVKIAKAVVEVESNFNPRARGRAGEVGLMQIKPATARGIGYRGSTKALYDPETNLEWGMKYLAGAHDRANGDLCGTILRYNAGHYAKRMNPVSRRYCSKVKRILASS
ncbi:MAG: transglycosylase SLT domain-containing protein [Roseibium sp.]|uniref:lytic transglycosylase domain-containing protein n=1 Tax=Roseibium sp. TaxID=1936156 RepID=UPI001B0ED923|nr:transglycosylase SLT domain-containing protein [Roseibium sp.]MBO6893550.1 transglycosylase SLT domain-containing protein [Roseibium sp.]MBO6929921.1 transglycosylase SLT domain-containing protein [Roseibium sp.]